MDDRFQHGLRALQAGDAHEALEAFRRILQDDARNAAAHYHTAQAHLLLKDRARALTALDAAIRIKSNEIDWRAERAALLFQQRSWSAALDDLQLATRGDLVGLRGRCHAALGDSIAALQDFDTAIALGNTEFAGHREALLAELRQFEELAGPTPV